MVAGEPGVLDKHDLYAYYILAHTGLIHIYTVYIFSAMTVSVGEK